MTLHWIASSTPDVEYRVYFRESEPNKLGIFEPYLTYTNVGKVLQWSPPITANKWFYFTVTAVLPDGSESLPSNAIAWIKIENPE